VTSEARLAADAELAALRRERDELRSDLTRREQELRQLATEGMAARGATERLAVVHERIADAHQRLPGLDKRLADLECEVITRDEAQAALRDFDDVWNELIPREQARLLKLIFATVEYDARAGTVSVTFRPTGIAALCKRRVEEAA
jgi:site-specific DNA recombinase